MNQPRDSRKRTPSTSVFFSNSCSPTLTMSRFMRLSSMPMADWSSSFASSMLGRRVVDNRRVGVVPAASGVDGGGVAGRLEPGGEGVVGVVDAGEGGTDGLLSMGGGRRAAEALPGSSSVPTRPSSPCSAAAASWSPKSTVHMGAVDGEERPFSLGKPVGSRD
jgi:hypothetical protein